MDIHFYPGWGETVSIANSLTATAAQPLPINSDAVLLANTSATAIAYAYVTHFNSANETQTGVAPTATNALPILPLTSLVIAVQLGQKVIRTIASAADGALIVTPGRRI